MKKLLSVFLTVLLIAFSFAPSCAFAADRFDPHQSGSISITLLFPITQEPLENVKMNLYRVADVFEANGKLEYSLAAGYTESGVSLACDDKGDFSSGTASFLSHYVAQRGINGISAKTDKNGRAYVGSCKLGLYLVVFDQAPKDAKYSNIDPVLISVPALDEEGSGYEFNVKASPKVPINVNNSTYMTDESTTKPDDPFDIDGSSTKPTKEDSTNQTDNSTNPDNPNDPNNPNNPNNPSNTTGNGGSTTSGGGNNGSNGGSNGGSGKPDRLPMTGTLQWPIPILATIGPVLFAFGYLDVTGRKRKNEED